MCSGPPLTKLLRCRRAQSAALLGRPLGFWVAVHPDSIQVALGIARGHIWVCLEDGFGSAKRHTRSPKVVSRREAMISPPDCKRNRLSKRTSLETHKSRNANAQVRQSNKIAHAESPRARRTTSPWEALVVGAQAQAVRQNALPVLTQHSIIVKDLRQLSQAGTAGFTTDRRMPSGRDTDSSSFLLRSTARDGAFFERNGLSVVAEAITI